MLVSVLWMEEFIILNEGTSNHAGYTGQRTGLNPSRSAHRNGTEGRCSQGMCTVWLGNLLDSSCGCNTLPQAWCLKTTHMYLLILEGRTLSGSHCTKSTVSAGRRSFWSSRENVSLSCPASRGTCPSRLMAPPSILKAGGAAPHAPHSRSLLSPFVTYGDCAMPLGWCRSSRVILPPQDS